LTPLPRAQTLCCGAAAIPKLFCELHDIFGRKSKMAKSCPKTPQLPSILSFYADIPKNNRPVLVHPNCSWTEGEPFDFENECICGTSHRNIYPCRQHPWGPDGIHSTEKEEEYFAIVKCPKRVEHLKDSTWPFRRDDSIFVMTVILLETKRGHKLIYTDL